MKWFNYILILLLSQPVLSQIAEVRTYGGVHFDEFNDIIETADGYVMIGSTSSPDNGNSDIYAVHVNFDLEFQWSGLFGGQGTEVGQRVLVDDFGDLYLIGYTSFGDVGGYDGYIAKVQADGALIWEVNIGSAEWDLLNSAQLWNGSLWVGGSTFNSISGLKNQYFVELDNSGIISQELVVESGFTESVEDMIVFNDELIVSFTREHNSTSDAGLYAMDNTLSVLWSYEKPGDEVNSYTAHHVDANDLNNVGWVIASYETVDFEDEMIMCRFDNNGASLGEYAVESAGNQIARSIAWSGDAAMNVANTDIYGAGGKGVYMERRVNNGVWTGGVVFGGENDEDPRRIIEDSEGRLLVVGTSNSYSDFTVDAYLFRLPSNFLVDDYILDLEESYDSFVTNVAEAFEGAILLYPNPSSGLVRVSGAEGVFHYKLFNSSGSLVEMGEQLEKQLVFNYPTGIYFLELEIGNDVHRLKLHLNP